MRRLKRYLCLATLLAITCAAAHAQPDPAPAQDQAEPKTVIRTYNVADLMRAAADYPLDSLIVPPTGYGAGAAGGDMFAGEAERPTKLEQVDELITLIQDSVASDSWHDNGGAEGAIRSFGPLLVVTQTPANHDKLQELLDELRRTGAASQVVSVRATWLALPSAADAPAPATVAADEWFAKQKVYCAARTVCFSGQTVHLTSGRGHTVVEDLTPIVADAAVAFDPTVRRVQSGVSLQVAPQLVPGAEVAVVDVQSFASEWAEPRTGPPARGAVATQPSGGAEVAADIDRMNILAQEMKTTLRVPLGKKFVVGGMTLDPAGGEKDARQLCLVVEISAVK